MRRFLAAAVVTLGAGCAPQTTRGGHADLPLDCSAVFSPSASAATLASRFGVAAITTGSVPLGDVEGERLPATILFADAPERRAAIVWRDTLRRERPRYVYLDHTPVAWRTPEGVGIGTSLSALERINGGPFHLAGFAFDAAGAVTSWDAGRLDHYKTGSCRIHFWLDSLDPGARSSTAYGQVLGDRVYSSQHPAMQSIDPRVSRLLLYP